MQENISERSGFVRLALGTGLTAFGVAQLTKESGSKTLGSALVLAGAMKVAEGIFLYCPMKALIGSNVKEAIYTSFDEYMDGDSLMRAYNDTYQNRWGNSSNTSKSSYSWADSGLAKVASQAMQSVLEGENPEQAINKVASTVNGSQSSNPSENKRSESKPSESPHRFENVASEVMKSVANGTDPAEAISKAASQMTNQNGGQTKSASNTNK